MLLTQNTELRAGSSSYGLKPTNNAINQTFANKIPSGEFNVETNRDIRNKLKLNFDCSFTAFEDGKSRGNNLSTENLLSRFDKSFF